MEKTEAKQRIDELKEILNEANRSYYILDAPEISDFEAHTRAYCIGGRISGV